jgi:UDP-glucose 4-epimerase
MVQRYFELTIFSILCIIKLKLDSHPLRHSSGILHGIDIYKLSVPIESGDLCKPINPYGDTKLVVEQMLKWYIIADKGAIQPTV